MMLGNTKYALDTLKAVEWIVRAASFRNLRPARQFVFRGVDVWLLSSSLSGKSQKAVPLQETGRSYRKNFSPEERMLPGPS
jgi:hypothetical protein